MQKLRKGFTLIELMIVLAISGLIIGLVLVAASAAQRNGRDTTRRADTQKLATAIEQWASNHNGALPKDGAELNGLSASGYIDANKFKDPSTNEAYSLGFISPAQAVPDPPFWDFGLGRMYYVYDSASPGTYKLITKLESGKFTYAP